MSSPAAALNQLPSGIAASLWRGAELGQVAAATVASGFPELDAELPGGGWPTQALTEILQPQAGLLEWRLLLPALRAAIDGGGALTLIAPPLPPHVPGLSRQGLAERQLVWIDAQAPAERLWATEQLIKSRPKGVVLAWLPQARPEHVRRLQACATHCPAPVFLFRPSPAQHEASAAPLRVLASLAQGFLVQLRVLKRRGPVHDGEILLPHLPAGLADVLVMDRPPAQLVDQPATAERVVDVLARHHSFGDLRLCAAN